MPYRSGKTQTLAGVALNRGDLLPATVISSIPAPRWGSLVRLGWVFEDLASPQAAAASAGSEGEMCPICGEGPFARLARHTTAKHEPEHDDEDDDELQETEDIYGDPEALSA